MTLTPEEEAELDELHRRIMRWARITRFALGVSIVLVIAAVVSALINLVLFAFVAGLWASAMLVAHTGFERRTPLLDRSDEILMRAHGLR